MNIAYQKCRPEGSGCFLAGPNPSANREKSAMATRKPNTKSAPKLAKAEVKRSAPVDAFLAGTADTRPSFSETICDLSTGIDLMIERLGYAFDVTSNLVHAPGEDGWYAMNAINETRWVAQRLSEEVTKVGREFKGSRSDRGTDDRAQRTEASA
jgi:hypothetical protein